MLGALLSLVHPALFKEQMQVLQALHHNEQSTSHRPLIHQLFNSWTTPFTGTSLIVNRETIPHRDTRGGEATSRYCSSLWKVWEWPV